ncbi:MAG TPA: hypothetical protein VK737_10835 [Opitutales bacterium]|jgi:hypothetical protein|nr:hypothetical protein [Opitutales bacterium]
MPSLKPKSFVFVLMPFSAEFDDLYTLGIKAACEAAGAHVERVDEQIFSEKIIERIYNQISKADLLVADMSGRNPNVFYEVGYAHALGQNVVLITKKLEDIPFDLMAYPHIIYGQSITKLKTELINRIKYFLKQKKTPSEKLEPSVLVYNEGSLVSPDKEILLDFRNCGNDRPEIVLDFHVPELEAFREIKQKFGIITSSFITRIADWSSDHQTTTLPDGRILHQSDRTKFKLLPGEWFKYNFTMDFESHVVNRLEKLSVRFFTNYGTVDTEFNLRMLGNTPTKVNLDVLGL